jgi:flagellin
MPQVINSNIASLNAQRNLNKSQTALGTSLQRLSSGLRINSAKDDAAGLSISQRFTSQIRGLNQAARNANDGISVAQVAEGALDETSNALQRVRELAIQSANGSNGQGERNALQQETSQLVAEIDRIATTTRFGSRLLLDGTFGSTNFQVGAQANETIAVTLGNAKSTNLGNNVLIGLGTASGAAVAGTVAATVPANTNTVEADLAFTVNSNGTALGTVSGVSYAANSSARTIAAAITTAGSSLGVTAQATTTATLSVGAAVGGDAGVTFAITGGTGTATIASTTVASSSDLTNFVTAINNISNSTGVTARFASATDRSSILLENTAATAGADIAIGAFNTTTAGGTATFTNTSRATVGLANGQTIANLGAANLVDGSAVDSARAIGVVDIQSTRGQVTLANANATFTAAAGQASSFNSVSAINISTEAGAQSALGVVDAALETIASQRGDLGAIQNRLESTISNLSNVSENVSAARSRILDADFAAETAALTKNQILQQAGISVLSQANSLPQQVLSLLQ